MVSCWSLLVLVVCGLFLLQAPMEGHEDQSGWLQRVMERLEKLEAARDRSQVAFTASLVTTVQWTHQGPFSSDTKLVFQKVTTNIGNAYNSETGVFTAPTKGLYYISFTGSVGNSGSLNAAVLKNGATMFAIYNTQPCYSADSNGMALELEEGDRMWVVLWKNHSIFDQSRLSTFSGFLIFPM
ncbi:complement C1q tumor necrosis factor-related protein 3-like [Anabas testudineus]|uniref:C1q domain-containing protein n=1 Tax=Anabas testudineus TaxID=64144 RepID=A0AAQ6IVC4_ANATE|nr:complement C1q tumor necrosis factor-related protein 3-like [Anabas testudineus]